MSFTFNITGSFAGGFFGGVAASTRGVPSTWHVSLAGRGYMLDIASGEFRHQTVAMLKQDPGADAGEPGEVTLNPEAAFRRATSSWHGGAGQAHLDLEDSTRRRFRASKGVDVWERGQLTLLPDTEIAHALAGTGAVAQIVSSDGYLYFTDDQQVKRTDLTTPATCTGTPASDVLSLASSGSAVYAAYGTNGVYKTTGTAFSSFEASDANLVAWAKGRVLAADGKLLNDISSGTAVQVLNHGDTEFDWVAIADGVSVIYAAGNSGARSLIYRIGITADGTALDAPVVAARLPDGETVAAMIGYLDTLIIGTNLGFRLAAQSSDGSLTLGPLIELGREVRAFCAKGDSVWFGWTNYDDTSTGTGRINLGFPFTSTLVPPYASDLMVTGAGVIDGLAFLGSDLAIGVVAVGVYQPDGLVASGTLESGRIRFGITEDKNVIGGTVDWDLPGNVVFALSVEGSEFSTLEERGEAERGTYVETRLTLTASGEQSPTVRSTTLRAFPAPERTTFITLPLLLHSVLHTVTGAEVAMDVNRVLNDIESLAQNQQITTLQVGSRIYTVKVEDYAWLPQTYTTDHKAWNGTLVAKCKTIG